MNLDNRVWYVSALGGGLVDSRAYLGDEETVCMECWPQDKPLPQQEALHEVHEWDIGADNSKTNFQTSLTFGYREHVPEILSNVVSFGNCLITIPGEDKKTVCEVQRVFLYCGDCAKYHGTYLRARTWKSILGGEKQP